jgi:release factor glutamine methyltransferase
MDLLIEVPPHPAFDVILSSPPKHAGEPRDLADRGWHAGPQYGLVAGLFKQARERLKPDGCLYVMVSSDSDLDLFGRLINKAGFRAPRRRALILYRVDTYLLVMHVITRRRGPT